MRTSKPPGLFRLGLTLLLLTTCVSSTYSSTDEEDPRIISYQDLMGSGGENFSYPGVTSYGPLLFDVGRDQLFVGARDNLFRLSLRGLGAVERAQWAANENIIELCQNKGQTEVACHNYVKILLSDGHRLFTCGTGAFYPVCSWRQLENVSVIIEKVSGLAKCPYNPNSNITALLTMEGQYYVGTPTDFSGSDHAIYRAFGSGNEHTLRTSQYNSKWLNEPQFVGSFEDDKFVYFVFREAAVEYINCGKKIYSRIARVCKNDSGGQHVLRDNWTTFVKARLNCSLPGEYPFYYDEIQGIEYLPQQRMLYATFTTPRNSIAGSAICAFNMTAIDNAFRGAFKHQENPGAAWESRQARHHPHGHCSTSSFRAQQVTDSSLYQLMDLAVQSSSFRPLHTADLERYTLITVAQISTVHSSQAHMLFVATEDGLVKKLSVLPEGDETCVIEIWKPQPHGVSVLIKSLQYLKETESIYIATNEEVMRIPIARCSRFVSRVSCLASGDPLCGWDNHREICSVAPSLSPSSSHWTQLPPACPNVSASLDGGWSSWSEWETCYQHSDGMEENEDKCLCQTRQCNNPPPKNGGKPCSGTSIRVTNCTVHGGWTSWSGWSACSATCGVAVKWRRRTCGAPTPAHGGRVCVGPDRQEIYCTGISPCPAPVVPVIEGGWSDWTPWTPCSAPCGGGVRWRSRRCDNPSPPEPPEGLPCPGCSTQAEVCNAHPCESKRTSAWTPWITLTSNTSDSGLVEKRYKFSCKAQTSENIKITLSKEEERAVSSGEGRTDGWSAWSSWGECTVACGGGFQSASRTCLKPPCQGSNTMQRACNVHSCIDGWGCWSEWSTCSATCGNGFQDRTRPCLFPQGCAGDGKQVRGCQIISCEESIGWSEWSGWSDCNSDGEQKRVRVCENSTCQGPSHQTRQCLDDEFHNDVMMARRPSVVAAGVIGAGMNNGMSAGWVAGAAIAGLVCGAALVAFAFFFVWGRNRPTRIPSSPLYKTQQNSYVTVPLKEVPKKRQPSFSGLPLSKTNNLNTNTTALMTPKLYPKAMAGDYESSTLKRNSNSNCRNNIDLEQEKFY